MANCPFPPEKLNEARSASYVPAVGLDPRTIVSWVNLDTPAATLGGAHNIWGYVVNLTPNEPITFTSWKLNIQEGLDPSVGSGTGERNVYTGISHLDVPETAPGSECHLL